MAETFATIGVVGLGTMGAGIVEVMARSGLTVIGCEVDASALTRGRERLEQSTARAIRRGKLTEREAERLLDRITFTTALEDLAEVEIVIEAVPEKLEIKRAVLGRLDRACGPDTILASNTSSLSVTEIAVSTSRPGRLVGVHFFNPAPVMKLVEIVTTVVTEPAVVDRVHALVERVGKSGVVVGDRAGFIANALLFGYLNHAVSFYENGYASREDIDAAMAQGWGLPMGPLQLLDLIGIDTACEICDTMYRQTGDRLHAPSPVLRQMAVAGLLGRKTGRGFYTYQGWKIVPDERARPAGVHDGQARQVSRVGLVGRGATLERLAGLCRAAGYETTVVELSDGEISDAVLSDLAGADLVATAGVEDADTLGALFAALDRVCGEGTVLASGASRSVISCAAATQRPADVVGMRLAYTGELIEVVSTVASDETAVATVRAVVERVGLPSISCADRAGFVADALMYPFLNDAVRMVEARYATVDDIDTAMTLGCGYPVGPFALLDEIGLDVALAAQERVYREVREPGFAPAPLLTQLVVAGRLGKRVGRGFRPTLEP